MKKVRGPRGEYQVLERFVREVESRFLARHLRVSSLGAVSKRERLDIAAYAVLTHGALENFVEGLGLWIVENVENSWLTKRRVGRPGAALLLYKKAPSIEDYQVVVRSYDNLRTALQEAKSEMSKSIQANHGVAPANLRALFQPLGVDVPDDPVLVASLNTLVKLRHQWAHQYRFSARVERSARDVKATVDDCLKLAKLLVLEVAAARP